MMDLESNRSEARGTQGWKAEELLKLSQLAPRKPRKRELVALFPNRTLGAIKLKLYHMRRALELPKCGSDQLVPYDYCTTMLDPDDPGLYAPSWQEAQRPILVEANAAFIAALQAAA